MKQTIRKNITDIPYSLHDAEICKMDAKGKTLTLHFKNGYVQNEEPYDDVKGTVEFAGVDWDCSFACVYKCKEFTLENTGAIEGEKQMLKDFAENFCKATLEIVDETFGYNETKLEGYLYRGKETFECSIGIYHMGDMSYLVEETSSQISGGVPDREMLEAFQEVEEMKKNPALGKAYTDVDEMMKVN